MATRTVLEVALTSGSNLRNALVSVQRVVEGCLSLTDVQNIEQVVTNGVVTAIRTTFDTASPDAEIKACLKGIANLVNKPGSGIASGMTFTLGFDSVAESLQRQYSV